MLPRGSHPDPSLPPDRPGRTGGPAGLQRLGLRQLRSEAAEQSRLNLAEGDFEPAAGVTVS